MRILVPVALPTRYNGSSTGHRQPGDPGKAYIRAAVFFAALPLATLVRRWGHRIVLPAPY